MPLLALQQLCCPLDGAAMQRDQHQWRCPAGHSFDIARQGYINLLPVQHKKSRDPGDSKEMVAARKHFLDSGHYAPIAAAINALLNDNTDDQHTLQVLDAGCGDGYYLQALSQSLDRDKRQLVATGLDISKWALRSCLQRNRQLNGIVASNRQVPLPDASVDILLCAFGFPVYAEFARLLRPGGLYLQVDSGPDHLLEMRQQLYREVRRSDAPSLDAGQQHIGPVIAERRLQTHTADLNAEELTQLLQMTPHYYRASADARQQLLAQAPMALSLDVRLRLLQRAAVSPAGGE
ncbi:putative RNA methyltransferase [Spongiibacter sp.]|uniref:putative RNA methyltransferase n=1 Tax=Spongiibacter sp. TaxID=2024860 RepID=UPI00356B450E